MTEGENGAVYPGWSSNFYHQVFEYFHLEQENCPSSPRKLDQSTYIFMYRLLSHIYLSFLSYLSIYHLIRDLELFQTFINLIILIFIYLWGFQKMEKSTTIHEKNSWDVGRESLVVLKYEGSKKFPKKVFIYMYIQGRMCWLLWRTWRSR